VNGIRGAGKAADVSAAEREDTGEGGWESDEDRACEWPREWRLHPGGVSGLVRRVRRTLGISQRGLAQRLRVSQSTVARWETGRTVPAADELVLMLTLAGLRMVVLDAEGDEVTPMRADGARDRGGRRVPAHADVYATDWWTPRDSSTHASHIQTWCRSRARKDPDIRYRLGWRREIFRTIWGTPVDHLSHHQLVAEVEWLDQQREGALGVRRSWAHATRACTGLALGA
jgi:transcriptional regulator with XRE-family HTH domain